MADVRPHDLLHRAVGAGSPRQLRSGRACGPTADERPSSLRRRVRIFSGIQPTGRKHLGNYIGAIRQYVEGQDRAAAAGDVAIYCVVNLHATTVPTTPRSCASDVSTPRRS